MAGLFNSAIFNNAVFNTGAATDTPIRGTSGYFGHDDLARQHRERQREEDAKEDAEAVIQAVAERQAADPRLDDRQRVEELAGEMKLRGIEMRSAHLEVLNMQREKIIRDELSRIFRERQDNEDVDILLMLAAIA